MAFTPFMNQAPRMGGNSGSVKIGSPREGGVMGGPRMGERMPSEKPWFGMPPSIKTQQIVPDYAIDPFDQRQMANRYAQYLGGFSQEQAQQQKQFQEQLARQTAQMQGEFTSRYGSGNMSDEFRQAYELNRQPPALAKAQSFGDFFGPNYYMKYGQVYRKQPMQLTRGTSSF